MVSGRGQLILIGALVIALTIIGISVVVNTVLFVENTPTDRQTARIDRAATIDDDARRAIRSTVLRVNHGGRDRTPSQVSDAVRRNVSGLNGLLEQRYLASQSLAVEVSYLGTTEEGDRVVQAADGTFTSGPSSDWSPVTGTTNRLGWFVVNLNATETGSERFHANVTDAGGDTLAVTFNSTVGGAFNVTTSLGGATPATVTCEPRGGRLALDLRRGRQVSGDGCRFDGMERLGTPTSVDFENGDAAVGKYAIVLDGPGATPGPCGPADPDEPCVSPVVWAGNVSVSVTSAEFSYRNRGNVSVYPEAS
jgi:hypothetical protein